MGIHRFYRFIDRPGLVINRVIVIDRTLYLQHDNFLQMADGLFCTAHCP